MKILIFLTLTALYLCATLTAEEAKCFNLSKWKEDASKPSTEKDMVEALNKSCHKDNPNDKEKSSACMRKTIESFMDIDGYKKMLAKYILNDEVKEKLFDMVDACKNDSKKFFPCITEKLEEACPEVKGFYRAEVRKLGYDI